MKLKDMVDVVINNDICVVLKVKDGQELNLISLGCFFGSESMFRLTKGRTVACTVFENSGKRYSFHWELMDTRSLPSSAQHSEELSRAASKKTSASYARPTKEVRYHDVWKHW